MENNFQYFHGKRIVLPGVYTSKSSNSSSLKENDDPIPPETSNKTILSLNWPPPSHLQTVGGITKINVPRPGVGITTPIGMLEFSGRMDLNYQKFKGAISGDNSGLYPDVILERCVAFLTNVPEGNFTAEFTGIENGSYMLRLLFNTLSTNGTPPFSAPVRDGGFSISINQQVGVSIRAFKDNVYMFSLEKSITITDNTLLIRGTMLDVLRDAFISWNVIEIEKM